MVIYMAHELKSLPPDIQGIIDANQDKTPGEIYELLQAYCREKNRISARNFAQALRSLSVEEKEEK